MRLKTVLVAVIIVLVLSPGGLARERLSINLAAGTRVLPWAVEIEKEFINNISLFGAFGATNQTYDISIGSRFYFHQPEYSFFLSSSGSLLYVLDNSGDLTYGFPFLHGGLGYEYRHGRFHVRIDAGVMYVPLTNFAPNINIGIGYDVW